MIDRVRLFTATNIAFETHVSNNCDNKSRGGMVSTPASWWAPVLNFTAETGDRE
jgi:hypothetical protein